MYQSRKDLSTGDLQHQDFGGRVTSNMFVVSGHLYMPLLLSQSWELGGKILGGFGTHPPTFFGAGLSILVFLWHLSPVGSTMWCGLKKP